ncbi:MAG: FAD-binding oxidoreductase [Anaerolineae bacterium]|nr:FAD-binding oxidoreductase [Anaerolineae bacterium]
MPTLCDLVIVGAGLAGSLVARRMAEAGMRVVVLEARHKVGGISARGGGLAILGTPEPYMELMERVGREEPAQIWLLTQRNLDLLRSQADELAVEVRRVGTFRPVWGDAAARALQKSVALLSADGFAASLEDATELGLAVGLQTQDDLLFDPLLLVEAALEHPRITVQTAAEVKTLEWHGEAWDIWTGDLFVRTKALVLAGGGHVVHLDAGLAAYLSTMPLQVIKGVTDAQGLSHPLILDAGRVLALTVGSHWQLSSWLSAAEADPWARLTQTAEQFCPEIRVVERYASWVARSADGLPVVGSLPKSPQLYTVGGLGPWGMSWAFVAVDHLVAMMLHDAELGLLDIGRFARD